MKKFLFALAIAGAMALTACQPTTFSAANSKSKLEGNGYTVTMYTDAEAKQAFSALSFGDYTISNAIYAKKGADANFDFILAFYFSSVSDAECFTSLDSNKNLGIFNSLADRELGSNLTKEFGITNNVAYVGSETSFSAAF